MPMISLELVSHPDKIVPIGETCEFAVKGCEPSTETRLLLKVDHIFYLQPFKDWSTETRIELYPESPGDYTLIVQWRDADGAAGTAEMEFEVLSGRSRPVVVKLIRSFVAAASAVATSAMPRQRSTDEPRRHSPALFQLDDATQFWMPNHWDVQCMARFEKHLVKLLPHLVRPGSVVYDVGANMGYYSALLARLTGESGHVYCVEANPLCVSYLRGNVELNAIHNFDVLPVALLDRETTCEFTVNYGSSTIGLVKGIHSVGKLGHRIQVPANSLDNLLANYPLREPDLIKIDIEGAEMHAVRGMLRTLARRRPTLLIELHGPAAAAQTLPLLDMLGYQYLETQSQKTFVSAREFMDSTEDGCLQVVARAEHRATSSAQWANDTTAARLQGSVTTMAWIGTAFVADGRLCIGGWVFSEDRAVDGFRVSCAGRLFDHVNVEMGIPSPDVVAYFDQGSVWSSAEQLAHCRFYMWIPLTEAEQASVITSVVCITPLVGSCEANPVFVYPAARAPHSSSGAA